MISAARLATLAAVLASVLAGCTVLDNRTLGITQEPSQRPGLEVAFFVWASHLDQVRLEIDAAPAGTFPTNTLITVDSSGLVPGEHLLTAHAVSGRPFEEASLRFRVDPPPRLWLTRVDPPFGSAVRTDQPLAVVLEFSEPVLLDGVAQPLGLRMTGPSPGAAIRSQAPDGLSVRFDVADLTGVATIGLQGQVRTARGGWFGFPPAGQSWVVSSPEVLASFLDKAQDKPVNGLVTLRPFATWNFGPPASAEILANDRVIFTLGPPPWDPVDWDTAALPEGRYVVWIRVLGNFVSQPYPWPSYLVDRTPPTATCHAESGRLGEISVQDCVHVSFSEAVDAHGGRLMLIDDGVELPLSPMDYYGSFSPCPLTVRTSGVVEQVFASSFTDLAGNPISSPICTLSVPHWFAPWGDGPLSSGGGEFHAAAMSVTGARSGYRATGDSRVWWAFTLAWIDAAGTPTGGALLVADGWEHNSIDPPETAITASLRPGHPSVSVDRLVATSGAGPGLMDLLALSFWVKPGWQGATPVILDSVVADDAGEPVVRDDPGVAVWTEVAAGGARALHGAAVQLGTSELWIPLEGDPRGSMTGSVSHPALTIHQPSSASKVALVAFLETAPGGGPRLRTASVDLGGGSWVPVMGDLDLGLGAPSDPAIAMAGELPALAWIEDGQVRLRMGTLGAAGLSFGPAVALNHDAALPARAARLIATLGARATLLFVEAGPTGDQLWARHWDGTSWVLQPGPINAGTGDAIVELAADGVPDAQGVVAWTDALGRVYLRVLNW